MISLVFPCFANSNPLKSDPIEPPASSSFSASGTSGLSCQDQIPGIQGGSEVLRSDSPRKNMVVSWFIGVPPYHPVFLGFSLINPAFGGTVVPPMTMESSKYLQQVSHHLQVSVPWASATAFAALAKSVQLAPSRWSALPRPWGSYPFLIWRITRINHQKWTVKNGQPLKLNIWFHHQAYGGTTWGFLPSQKWWIRHGLISSWIPKSWLWERWEDGEIPYSWLHLIGITRYNMLYMEVSSENPESWRATPALVIIHFLVFSMT